MRTFLLTWHPARWRWTDLEQAVRDMASTGPVQFYWSIGNRTDLPVGSRLFLMRLGEHPKGIIASGLSTTLPASRPHWDADRAAVGDVLPMVRVEFDVLDGAPRVSLDELSQPPFDTFLWTPQSSGVEIPAGIAGALEELWQARLFVSNARMNASGHDTLIEGGRREIVVNAYERNPAARRACIDHHGVACAVCDFSFEQTYGDDFAGFIHVHHLKPISEADSTRPVDPVRDLRPVCPNCHAAIHLRYPPYEIEELKALLNRRVTSA
jgi:5-methylcytosine-specific restriction protein A